MGALSVPLSQGLSDPGERCESDSRPQQDIAEIIAFAVSRPRGVSLNEILVRPTGQAG